VPCQRTGSSSWVDSSGNFWLFGGVTQVTLNEVYRNDLWKYDPTTSQWTVMSGSANSDVSASYGTQGSAAVGNIPGARAQSTSWTDRTGNLWLFGGHGDNPAVPSDVLSGLLNDLWEFNISIDEWVWVSGAQTLGAASTYETMGGSGTNTPGASGDDGFAMDADGNFWLYDGNDLWQYQPNVNEWFWMSGNPPTESIGGYGTYGTEGVAAPSNVPGTRGGSSLWIDVAGRVWLFGGNGNATSTAGRGTLNDLWEFVP
jgi:hypothetical protein